MYLAQAAFGLHAAIETAAALSFMLRPSATLRSPQPDSHGVIRQYAVLLLASSAIALAAAARPSDALAKPIAGALALYHAGPMIRAIGRLRAGEARSGPLGGPGLHLLVHVVCGLLLLGFCAAAHGRV